QSPAFIMRYIDWMALHKLNVLGWHLTDDQGWRLEIGKYPRLTSVGAWRVPAGRAAARDIDPATARPRLYGGFYTQDDVRRIVAHAQARNVTIVPEIDMPGHATAAIVAYPQLGATNEPPQAVPADWGIYPNLFNVEESTFAFLEDVLAEVMGLFPGEYIHVGGDEAVKDQWKASARVQARTEERAAYMTWPRAAALAEIGWSPPARLDWPDFLARLPAEFRRLSGLGVHYSDDALAPPHTVGPHERHMSQDLKTCTDKLVLSLEDDAPMEGARAVFLIDIMNPCWILPAADLSHGSTLTAAVGQVPFNFQIGKDIEAIKLNAPNTPAGELEVRLDGCQGEPVAVLPLAPAADNDAVTTLPAVPLPGAAGPHDLCFRFTQRTLDPLWALEWVQLLP